MKFGDKLIELRKKNGYSQEELAEKLGVSRQSVSKWESNNTYPETDKIVQIANLFDCSMDDLINDKITDVESSLRKNKNVYNIWDSLLEFLTKTINMFSHMTFSQGLNCLIELIILSLVLLVFGNIICGLASDIITQIFSFIGTDFPKILNIISTTTEGVFKLIWFILSIIVIIYTLKVRHLNDYEDETIKINEAKDNDKKDNKETKKEIKQEDRIIRHENEKPYEFLSVLSKIVLYFVKFIAGCILLGTASAAIGFVIASVLLGAFIPTNILFLWLSLIFIACTVISIVIIILLACFIFNKKVNIKATIITFIIAIVLFGSSIGMSVIQIKNIDFIDDNSAFKLETKELEFEYKDNLAISSNGVGYNNNQKYIIDNNLPENKIIISRQIDPRYFKLNAHETTIDNMPVIMVNESNENIKVMFEFFIEHLKDNKIYTFDEYGNDPLVIKANETTINNLKNNLKKLYLVEEKVDGNTTDITIKDDKVYFKDGLDGKYNAIDDSIEYYDEDYICKKEIEQTKYGERIVYICDEKED